MRNNPFRSFAIFGAMRSGSNLLERTINQFSGLKCHGELFNPAFIGWSGRQTYCGIDKSTRDAAPDQLIGAILADDSANIPGFRIFRDHNVNAIDQFLQDKTCAKIILTRNPLDSFVSLKIARKTDQWLIHDTAHRKKAQIYFDLREFEAYKETREKYNKRILNTLDASGQEYFQIGFDQLKDLLKMNELAAFLGAENPLPALAQPIKHQNPEPLWEKIVNYSEVQAALGLTSAPVDSDISTPAAPETGTDLSRAYFCYAQNIVFAPIPSAPDGSIRRWLAAHLGDEPENGFDDQRLTAWQKHHQDPLVFAVLRHPVTRAYDVFMRKIFLQNAGGFAAIREGLETKLGVFLPTKKDDHNYDRIAHSEAFKQFLAFIHHNLTEESDFRTDGRWRAQSDLIDGYQNSLGRVHLFQEPELPLLASYIENRFGLVRSDKRIMPDAPDWPQSLAQIYDNEVESLARVAYAADYQRFKFGNWA